MHAVLGLIEDDARGGLEDLIGHLDSTPQAELCRDRAAHGSLLVVERREAVHETRIRPPREIHDG